METGRRQERVRLRRDPTVFAGCLLAVSAVLFVSGLFVPLLRSEVSTATLFDLPATTIGIYVGLCIVACVAVPFALAGGQRAAGIAAGALVGLTLVHVITAAAVSLALDQVHMSAIVVGFREHEVHLAIGFWLYCFGSLAAVLAAVIVMRICLDSAQYDEARARPLPGRCCAGAMLVACTAVVIPMIDEHGRGGAGLVPNAIVFFAVAVPLLGILGARWRTRAGLGLSFGSALTLVGVAVMAFLDRHNTSNARPQFQLLGTELWFILASLIALLTSGFGLLTFDHQPQYVPDTIPSRRSRHANAPAEDAPLKPLRIR